MQTIIEGIYKNGIVTFNEEPPFKNEAKVFVTFTGEVVANNEKQNPRKAGFGKGTFLNIADDFDAPLEDLKDYM